MGDRFEVWKDARAEYAAFAAALGLGGALGLGTMIWLLLFEPGGMDPGAPAWLLPLGLACGVGLLAGAAQCLRARARLAMHAVIDDAGFTSQEPGKAERRVSWDDVGVVEVIDGQFVFKDVGGERIFARPTSARGDLRLFDRLWEYAAYTPQASSLPAEFSVGSKALWAVAGVVFALIALLTLDLGPEGIRRLAQEAVSLDGMTVERRNLWLFNVAYIGISLLVLIGALAAFALGRIRRVVISTDGVEWSTMLRRRRIDAAALAAGEDRFLCPTVMFHGKPVRLVMPGADARQCLALSYAFKQALIQTRARLTFPERVSAS
jgi:hypothetical protein